VPVLEPQLRELNLADAIQGEADRERGSHQAERGGSDDRHVHDAARDAHRPDAPPAVRHDLDRPVGRRFMPFIGGSV
jgi:hypothetical protein